MTGKIKLNLARNCLKYIIKTYGIKEIFVPYYTCPVVWNAAREENCKVKFYHIRENFMPECDFDKDNYIIYTNYFGLCGHNCTILSQKYPNLIVDNSHAFYAPHTGLASFNSLRKFFTVQNGAYLFVENKLCENFLQDNLKLNPVVFHQNTEQFVKNELILNNERQIKTISALVEKQMDYIDFDKDKLLRVELYNKYDEILSKFNKIKLKLPKFQTKEFPVEIPYCYPLSCGNSKILSTLSDNKFALLRLWKNIPESFAEYKFLNDTIALPLNDEKYAVKIIDKLKKAFPVKS